MNHRVRVGIASAAIVAIFVLIQLGALALVEPFKDAGLQPVENPDDPTITVVYVLAILVMTGLVLAAFRFGYGELLRAVIVLIGAYITAVVLGVLAPEVTVGGANAVPLVGAAAVAAGLWFHPEWYVIDLGALVMGIGAAGLFGITFGILPAIILLVVLAVYDAISVYKTEHMLTLASGVMDLRVPIVFVVPMHLSYSYRSDDPGPGESEAAEDGEGETAASDADQSGETGETVEAAAPDEGGPGETVADPPADVADRDALFIGLGDAVIPAVLVASAGFFLEDVPVLGLAGLSIPLPAATATVGTVLGLGVLLWMVLKGRAHAGLPLLNGGVIGGYLVGALASGMSIASALGLEAWL